MENELEQAKAFIGVLMGAFDSLVSEFRGYAASDPNEWWPPSKVADRIEFTRRMAMMIPLHVPDPEPQGD